MHTHGVGLVGAPSDDLPIDQLAIEAPGVPPETVIVNVWSFAVSAFTIIIANVVGVGFVAIIRKLDNEVVVEYSGPKTV